MLSLILKILRDKVGELYNSINRKMQPLPFGDDQDYILDSDTVTVSDFWKDFKKYSQSPALIGVFYRSRAHRLYAPPLQCAAAPHLGGFRQAGAGVSGLWRGEKHKIWRRGVHLVRRERAFPSDAARPCP